MYFLLLLILSREVQSCTSRSSATMKSHADKKIVSKYQQYHVQYRYPNMCARHLR
jgi:hypothetical protein